MSSTILAGIVIVATGAAVAALGFRAVVRWRPRLRDEEHTDVKGVYFSMVGLLYAILLAFVVVVAWEQFNEAESATETEVTRLSNLLRDSNPFPPDDRARVQSAILTYAEHVIEREYDAMAEGTSDGQTNAAYENIWNQFYAIRVTEEPAASFYGEALGRLNELGEARRLRVLASQSTIPVPLWILLIGGGLFAIVWLYPFHMRNVRTQTWAIGTLGGFTGFILFLIYALQHPFTGDVAIDAGVYESLVDQWKHRR